MTVPAAFVDGRGERAHGGDGAGLHVDGGHGIERVP